HRTDRSPPDRALSQAWPPPLEGRAGAVVAELLPAAPGALGPGIGAVLRIRAPGLCPGLLQPAGAGHQERDESLLGRPPEVVAEGQQPCLCERLSRLKALRGAAVAPGRLAVAAVEAAREVVRVGKTTVVSARGAAGVAADQQRGRPVQAQQLEGGHRSDPVVLAE